MKRILVIEDQDDVREAILEMLEAEGYEGLGAENGRRGVELARQHLPNLIISDVAMPVLDGFGALTELQQDPVTATIPFIFLTARAEKEDRRQGMLLGADDYLTKPFSLAELRTAIQVRLDKQSTLDQKFQGRLEELRASITLSLPHELRTPLTGILGFSEILADECAAMKMEDIQNAARLIYHSGLRLQRLIENFLLYTELEQITADPEQLKIMQAARPISFTQSVIVAAAQQESQNARRGDDLILSVQDAPIAIAGRHLRKLTEELVNNACKFSASGAPVEVTGQVRAEQQDYLLAVQDHGRGISARQIAEIGAYMQFGRQVQEQQGAGLGLIISKRIAELHGGTIKIESAPEQGTTVQVTLPVLTVPADDE